MDLIRIFGCNIKSVWILFLIFVSSKITNATNYVYKWAVEVNGGPKVADEVARLHGYENHGIILPGENFFLFSKQKLRKRSTKFSKAHHERLSSHPNVGVVQQQQVKKRVKRDLIEPEESPPWHFQDPDWDKMWYLHKDGPRPSMRVMEAWQAGYTGKGVSVTILDDGIERDHPDLEANYYALASDNINPAFNTGSDPHDPMPRLTNDNMNRHGTRCAGEVAAVANNSHCSVGIAYHARIGGVRMLDGKVTDEVEARSIGMNPQHVDVYSASWGPDDDGVTVDGPATLARIAFRNGALKGRGGKGSIFVWASGNGGREADNCNCDGYTNSIYTLSISSSTERGTEPWYSESCSSTLATTYSSGSSGSRDRKIATTDLRHQCTDTHTGTSASAPLAAGICALALEANGNLTWRDMQHLVVRTSNPVNLKIDDWVVNDVGRKVSHAFGYGMMDAYAMTQLARNWTSVPVQRVCNVSVISPSEAPRYLSTGSSITVPVEIEPQSCAGADDAGNPIFIMDHLEHVQAELTLSNYRRGDLSITLTSPGGTTSQLLGRRSRDRSGRGFNSWAFMTTHSWDETPCGSWLLEITDHGPSSVSRSGRFDMFNLILHGTYRQDWHPSNVPEYGRRATPCRASHASASSTTADTSTNSQEERAVERPDTQARNQPDPQFAASVDGDAATDVNGKDNVRCQTFSSTLGCLACKRGFSLDPDSGTCVLQCGPGRYASQSPPVGSVCRPCPAFCYRCSHADDTLQCVQCVASAVMVAGSACVVPDDARPALPSGGGWNMYALALSVVVFGLVAFAAVLCIRNARLLTACCSGVDTLYKYKYVATEHDDDDDVVVMTSDSPPHVVDDVIGGTNSSQPLTAAYS